MTRYCVAMVVVWVSFACANLETPTADICGNGFLEANEDCDGQPGCGDLQSSPAQQCRWLCNIKESEPCYEYGYACGLDGICRQPSGAFDPWQPVSLAVDDLQIADVDGDGYPDLAGASEAGLNVRYGGAELGFSSAFALPTPPLFYRPAFGKLGKLDRSNRDVVGSIMPTELGLLITEAEYRKQSLRPVAATTPMSQFGADLTDLRVVPIQIAESGAQPYHVAVVVGDTGSETILGTLDDPEFRSSSAHLTGKDFNSLTRVAVADVDAIPGPERAEEFALAFAGASSVFVHSVDAGYDIAVLAEIEVSGLGNVSTEVASDAVDLSASTLVLFADVDNDGALDLLIAVGSVGEVAVALGDGSGNFGVAALNSDFGSDSQEGEVDGMPVVVADFNDDGLTDYVASNGIYIDDGAGAFAELYSGGDFSSVQVGDFNRDGRLDLVSAGHREIVLRLGDGLGFFGIAKIGVVGSVQELRVGDFDGDRVDDVAVVGADVGTNGGSDVLQVVFGVVDGLPAAPVEMLRLDEIIQIEAGHEVGQANWIDDLATDLVVRSVRWSDDRREITLLSGAAQRFMVSGVTVTVTGSYDGLEAPEQVFMGSFLGDGSALALAATSDGHLWALQAEDGTLAIGDGAVGADTSAALGSDTSFDCVRWLVAEVDASSAGDELVGVHDHDCEIGEAGGGPRVLVLGLSGTTVSPDVELLGSAPISAGRAAPADLIARDLDDDGYAELIVTHHNGWDREDAAIQVYWGTASGLDLANPSEVPLPELFDDSVLSVAVLNADSDAELELAVLLETVEDPEAVYLADLVDGEIQLSPSAVLTLEGYGSAIFAADFNRDGVDDLLTADGTEAILFAGVHQFATSPDAGTEGENDTGEGEAGNASPSDSQGEGH